MFKTFCYSLIIALVITQAHLFRIPILSDIQEIITLGNDIANIVTGNAPIYSLFSSTPSSSSSSISASAPVIPDYTDNLNNISKGIAGISNQMTEMLDTIVGLSSQVDTLGDRLDNKLDTVLNTLLTRIPLEGKLADDMKDFRHYISRIDYMYQTMTEMLEDDFDDIDELTMDSFVETVLSFKQGDIPDILNSMLDLVVPKKDAADREGLLELIIKRRNITDDTERCNLDISFQYRLYKFYNTIIIAESKAFLMAIIALKYIEHSKNSKPKKRLKKVQAEFIMRAEQYLLELKKEISKGVREIYRCQITEFIPDETYGELRQLFSDYVINIKQRDYNCGGNCEQLSLSTQAADCQHTFCHRQPCKGEYYDCKSVGSRITLCENFADNPHRYAFLYSFSKDQWYGQWTNCATGKRHEFRNSESSCQYCLCKCLETSKQSSATRTFSFIPQYSDIASNMVVSDIKFTLKNKTVHVQIKQAPLLPDGYLNKNLSSWVPLPELIHQSCDGGSFVMKHGRWDEHLENFVNFTYIDGLRRSFNLDQISAEPGYVVTGVRLNLEKKPEFNETSINRIQLEIYASPFDAMTGKIIIDGNHKWITPTTQHQPPREYTKEREQFVYKNIVRDFENDIRNPYLTPNKFIEFDASADIQDLGKYTVPFLDLRPIDNGNDLAINGLGTFYMEAQNTVGYISLKILTIDLSQRLKPSMTPKQIKSFGKLYRKPLSHTIPKSDIKSKK